MRDKKIATFSGKEGSEEKIEKWKAEREKLINERIKHIDALQKTGMEQIKQQDWYTPEVGKTIEEMSGMQADQTLNPALYPGHIPILPKTMVDSSAEIISTGGEQTGVSQHYNILYEQRTDSSSMASSATTTNLLYYAQTGKDTEPKFYGT